MEVSVIQSSQAKALALPTELGHRELGLCSYKAYGFRSLYSRANLSFSRKWRPARLRVAPPMAVLSDPVRSNEVCRLSEGSKSFDTVKLFVGLPLDLISECNTVIYTKAITAGLKALKLLGVEGVEVPVWWGVVEGEAMGKYEWSGYLTLAEMVQNAGLKLHVSLNFHGSKEQNIPLPPWVSKIGKSDPNIFFSDYSNQRYEECLSLAVDDIPVLNGKTPLQVYLDFCQSFKATFLSRARSMIKGVSIGLGPDGELRYPSHHRVAKGGQAKAIPGVGEFQCYDKNMLSLLKLHAEAAGNPLWGLSGPHDTPRYNESPNSTFFFNNDKGSWETPYGDFFLSWYSGQLLQHGDRVLSMASSVFKDSPVDVYGRLPLVHSWYGTRSHASELTAGFYNTCFRDGYDAVAEMFAKNSCKMILPGMDLSDKHQPRDSCSNPELLLRQIGTACRKHRVKISGQNSSFSDALSGFEQIEKNLLAEKVTNLFTYQRMGAYFFSPEHFPAFTRFVRNLNQLELEYDDQIREDDEDVMVAPMASESSNNMQAA